MKNVIVFCLIILTSGQAVAAIKNCEELQSEIAAKLSAAGVSSFVLAIVDKDQAGNGKILGSCEGGTKRIVRLPVAAFAPRAGQAERPSRPSITLAYGRKDCDELKSEIAAKLSAAGVSSFVLAIVDKDRTGNGKILASCEGGAKRIVRLPASGSLARAGQAEKSLRPSATLAYYGMHDCEKLKSEIAAKLVATGISPSGLALVDKDWVGADQVLGSCDKGTKRIVHLLPAGSLFGVGQAERPSLPAVTLAYGIKDCEELKSEIAAKLVAAGVPSFVLAIVDKDRTGSGKIIGSCENGTKRIVRRKSR
ncbi:MAG: DUF1161 domain-containing protein [Candidatus Electrothrix sp. GW3-4]|uniref:DUF1161 domain-containing protein n=1 Tax=Candidatus Electrothrix sp. GW3-4 TaxID=3126740 RepID=UPI0030CF76D8